MYIVIFPKSISPLMTLHLLCVYVSVFVVRRYSCLVLNHSLVLQEVSLAFLLKPVWISSELSQTIPDPDTPSLHRRQSMRKSVDVAVDKRSSTPTLLTRYHLNPDVLAGESRRESFPGQVFRENPTPQNVILNYHPQYLNNDEWFASRDTATLTPLGYRVSGWVHACGKKNSVLS